MNEQKNIQNYFPIQPQQLTANSITTFQLYLYLEKNNHIITWKTTGEFISQALLESTAKKNIQKLWIHKSEKESFESYLKNNLQEEQPSPHPEEPLGEEITALLKKENIPETVEAPVEKITKTKEGSALREILQSPDIPNIEKKELLSTFGESLIQEALKAANEKELKKTKLKAKYIVQDLLLESSLGSLKIAQELWKISDTQPELTHSINVSTYAVVFAMAFGRIDEDVLSDIALAGLLHDSGTSQIAFQIAKKPWSILSKEEKLIYFSHPEHSIALIEKSIPTVSELMINLIHQQHEQFNGQGYPRHIKGFEFDDLAQILSLAEVFESFSNAQWDGTTRSMKESFELLDKLEKEKNFPQFFNPDIFGVVLNWLKSQVEKEKLESASKTVQKQSQHFMKNAA